MDAAVTLEALQNPTSAYYSEAKLNSVQGSTGNIRLDAVKEAAMGVGVRGGLKARTDELNDALKSVDRQMDVAYDFRPYLVEGRVLPPVILEAHDIYTQGDDVSLRLAGRAYRIESQARFVSRAPTWREYLLMNHEISMPSAALMPKTSEEEVIWKVAVAEGWKQGIEQAEGIFQANYDRLHRDYLGIIRFHKLVASNVVTMPIIAQSRMAISGTKNKEISVDEALLRITALPAFNMNVQNWQPVPAGRLETVDRGSPMGKPLSTADDAVDIEESGQ